jgi:metal-responsive CopG/Arc/MetJ family transcriptional regulator
MSKKIQVILTEKLQNEIEKLQDKSDFTTSEIVRLALLEYLGVIKK